MNRNSKNSSGSNLPDLVRYALGSLHHQLMATDVPNLIVECKQKAGDALRGNPLQCVSSVPNTYAGAIRNAEKAKLALFTQLGWDTAKDSNSQDDALIEQKCRDVITKYLN